MLWMFVIKAFAFVGLLFIVALVFAVHNPGPRCRNCGGTRYIIANADANIPMTPRGQKYQLKANEYMTVCPECKGSGKEKPTPKNPKI